MGGLGRDGEDGRTVSLGEGEKVRGGRKGADRGMGRRRLGIWKDTEAKGVVGELLQGKHVETGSSGGFVNRGG